MDCRYLINGRCSNQTRVDKHGKTCNGKCLHHQPPKKYTQADIAHDNHISGVMAAMWKGGKKN